MNNFGEYITPERAKELDDKINGRKQPLSYYKELAKNHAICPICGQNPVWRFGDCGLCFSCTTGEADASDDYEIIGE
jgi:hypothetical protein